MEYIAPNFPPGAFGGAYALTNEEYHGDTTHISKSGISIILEKTPAHYYAKYLDPLRKPSRQTPAMAFGSLTHKAILEPDDFENEYIVVPADAPERPTAQMLKAKNPSEESKKKIVWWEDFENRNAGKKIADKDDYDTVKRMRDSVHKHPAASRLLGHGYAEQTFFTQCPVTGAPIKVRPDWLNNYVVDLKTTDDASAGPFGKSSANYTYDLQPPLYLDVIEEATGTRPEAFIFIAVEKEPPYAVACYYTPADVINSGQRKYRKALRTYMQCKETGIWHAYSDKVEALEFPHWAFE